MASNIDETKPTEGTATTQSVRDNFSAAKDEIEALQSTPSISSYTEYQEASEPSPGTNAARLYAFDQNGETRMHYITPDGLVIDIAQDNTFVVRNQSGSNMSKGDVVYVSSQTGPVPDVELAQSNSLSTVPAVGVLAEDIDNNDFGVAIKVGILESINTSAFNVGDVLYVSASVAGGLTATRPPHPHLNQPVATVLVSGVGNGSIKIDIEYPEGDELGTRENTYKIGDGTAGTITLTFDNDADGSLTWDGTKFSIGGKEFALDSDGNTSITADTDDQIDVKIGGSDQFSFTPSSLNTSLLAETTESGMRGVLKVGSLSTETANFNVTADGYGRVYILNGASGDVTATLPALSGVSEGWWAEFINAETSHKLTVDGNGAETIEGVSGIPLPGLSSSYSRCRCRIGKVNGAWQLLEYSPQPWFKLTMGSTQSINASTKTKLDLSVVSSTDQWGWADTANDRWIPKIPGVYSFYLSINLLDGLADADRMFGYIQKNGSDVSEVSVHAATGAILGLNLSTMSETFNGSTDYIEGYIFHNNSSSRRVSNASDHTFLTGRRIG